MEWTALGASIAEVNPDKYHDTVERLRIVLDALRTIAAYESPLAKALPRQRPPEGVLS